MSCPWEAEPAAKDERRRRCSGVRGKKGPGRGGAVEAMEGEGATNLGREKAEEAIPWWTEAQRRQWRGGGSVRARRGPGRPFIGK
jgi:hypothetical protein